jgi:hypothetical protein
MVVMIAIETDKHNALRFASLSADEVGRHAGFHDSARLVKVKDW